VTWFSPITPVFSTNKTDCHDITAILLKVALNTINQPSKMCISPKQEYFIGSSIKKFFLPSHLTNRLLQKPLYHTGLNLSCPEIDPIFVSI
jgi:hypothetical protein